MISVFTTYRKFFLVLTIIAFLGLAYFIKENRLAEIVISKIAMSLFFMLYFFKVLQKSSYWLLFSVLLFFASTTFFSLETNSTIAMVFIFFYRIALLKIAVNRRVDWKLFFKVFLITTIIIALLFTLLFRNTLFYYLSIANTLVLLALVSLAFVNLVVRRFFKDALFFMAIALFVVCDMILGSRKIENVMNLNVILGTLLYYLSFFFICKSQEIKFVRKNKIWK